MSKLYSIVIALLFLIVAACSPLFPAASTAVKVGANPQTPENKLVVFAAASLTEAFTALGEKFEAEHPGTSIEFNFASSHQLVQQIAQGAPADVFASANQKQMDAAVQTGRVVEGSSREFVQNQLIVVLPVENPAGIRNLEDLARDGLKLVFAAREVPAGQYSLEFLEKTSNSPAFPDQYQQQVLENVVSYENSVRSVLTKVTLGEADGGIVYISDLTGQPADRLARIEIPAEFNAVASYPIAPVLDAASPELAQEFVALVLSTEGQTILAAYGFIPIQQ